jgi:hypothetical protein
MIVIFQQSLSFADGPVLPGFGMNQIWPGVTRP